jgi:hypothetical protein
MPVLQKASGSVLGSPRFVPITFGEDPRGEAFQKLVAAIGTTGYWKQVTKEYGVGAATSAPPVSIRSRAPASIDDEAIQAWLGSLLDGTHPEVPPPDASTVYLVAYPSGTRVSRRGAIGCEHLRGYHGEAKTAAGVPFAYVVLPRCDGGFDELTRAATEQLIAVATNPYPVSAPAYASVDERFQAWLGDGAEATDLCKGSSDRAQVGDLGIAAARGWSNKAAAAGKDPCVPAPGAYFNAVPILPDMLEIPFRARHVPGVRVPDQGERTIVVRLYSDAPMKAWVVEVTHGPGIEARLVPTSGKNGDTLHLTFRSTNRARGTEVVTLTSMRGDTRKGSYRFLVSND